MPILLQIQRHSSIYSYFHFHCPCFFCAFPLLCHEPAFNCCPCPCPIGCTFWQVSSLALIVAFHLSTKLVASMSWVEGLFCAFLALASKSDFTTHSIFYAKINDHGIRRGKTGQILTQWWRPMASRVALDLPYWAMCSALYHLIRMAIGMASKVGAYFSAIDFMSCINVVKQPC
jgi:hypothetical protein